MKLGVFSFLLLNCISQPYAALAQDDDVPIGQGEAAIQVRSDVKVAIRGTGGTPKAHLEKLGAAVAKAVPDVRRCYSKLVRERATATGIFQVTVTLNEGAKKVPDLLVKTEGDVDPALQRCVVRRLARANYREVPRPAAAVVTMGLDNSRAAGQSALEEQIKASNVVDVVTAGDGFAEASWASQDGSLRFQARAEGAQGADAVRSAIRGLQSSYAGFLDCRRKSEKGGLSPAGEAQTRLVLRGPSNPTITVGSCTIRHERAPICMARAFRRTRFPDAPRGVRVDVTVTFAE